MKYIFAISPLLVLSPTIFAIVGVVTDNSNGTLSIVVGDNTNNGINQSTAQLILLVLPQFIENNTTFFKICKTSVINYVAVLQNVYVIKIT
jgi:hypothetical protein